MEEINYENDIKGSFDAVPESLKNPIIAIVANFHYRDIYVYPDGSMGTIKISPKQFRDCLAYIVAHVILMPPQGTNKAKGKTNGKPITVAS